MSVPSKRPLSKNEQNFAHEAVAEIGKSVKRLNRVGRRKFGLPKDIIRLTLLTLFEILGEKAEISSESLLKTLRKNG